MPTNIKLVPVLGNPVVLATLIVVPDTVPQTTTLNGGLNADSAGTGGSGTTINVASTTGFPSTGTNFILVGTEEISYTGVTSTSFTGITRNVRGTTNASHSTGATVTDTSNYAAWGQAASTTDKVAEPGMWSLDNLGDTLIALIFNGECFQWDSNLANAVTTRATIISGAPTASRDMLVSTPDRHLVFFGTETTIGDKTTQDDMFISCLLYTSPSPRDGLLSRMPSSA